MDLGIAGRTALVLGVTGGLGGAVASALAAEGARVACAGRDAGRAENVAATIRDAGGEAMSVVWDLTEIDGIPAVLAGIEARMDSIDILINVTGGPPPTPATAQEPALWRKHFEGMVLSVVALTDAVLPGMRARKWGRIVTSTSSGVVAPIPNLGLSNALRSTLVGWSKTLAREVGRDGVTANIVVPGRIATQRITFLDEQKACREGRRIESVVSESTGSIPLGRYGHPQEYAAVVAFLASVPAAYVNGAVIRVDGGLISSI